MTHLNTSACQTPRLRRLRHSRRLAIERDCRRRATRQNKGPQHRLDGIRRRMAIHLPAVHGQGQSGELPWTKLDDLASHDARRDAAEIRYRFISATTKRNISIASGIGSNLGRTRYPDLQRLKSRFVITTLSNGNISLLTNMAKHAGLPWDCILSAENVRRYKPDPEVYLLVAATLRSQTRASDDGRRSRA